MSLGPGCVHVGIVMHELMHAAGFWHEQSRHDRDFYVTINWRNIKYGKHHNFEKVSGVLKKAAWLVGGACHFACVLPSTRHTRKTLPYGGGLRREY